MYATLTTALTKDMFATCTAVANKGGRYVCSPHFSVNQGREIHSQSLLQRQTNRRDMQTTVTTEAKTRDMQTTLTIKANKDEKYANNLTTPAKTGDMQTTAVKDERYANNPHHTRKHGHDINTTPTAMTSHDEN